MSTISRGSKLKLLPSQSREDPGPTIAADQKAWLSSGVIPLSHFQEILPNKVA